MRTHITIGFLLQYRTMKVYDHFLLKLWKAKEELRGLPVAPPSHVPRSSAGAFSTSESARDAPQGLRMLHGSASAAVTPGNVGLRQLTQSWQ